MYRWFVCLLGVATLTVFVSGCAETTSSTSHESAPSSSSSDATGESSDSYDDQPPPLSRAAYKSLKRGMTRRQVFARIGRSAFAEGPSAATWDVGAERCYSYRIPGTLRHDDLMGDQFDQWWICFNGTASTSKLVHKERE
jgi:hypothetical protein